MSDTEEQEKPLDTEKVIADELAVALEEGDQGEQHVAVGTADQGDEEKLRRDKPLTEVGQEIQSTPVIKDGQQISGEEEQSIKQLETSEHEDIANQLNDGGEEQPVEDKVNEEEKKEQLIEDKDKQPVEDKDKQPVEEKEEKAEEKEAIEEVPVISYDYESLKSKPVASGNVSNDLLHLHHSFGYECQKRSNLLTMDENTLVFAAGNFIMLLDTVTQGLTYLRTLGGAGVGAITAHPSKSYFAVGEKGDSPVIAIYTYPELVLHRILRGGTEQQYSHMDFSPKDGNLLASVGGYPDYMLTVWDWEKEHIVLRSKAFSQDIYRVSFSPELPGQLTTAGTGHIRFWKMATTFTGLKLQGYLGKFGRTELSDISAYAELPDGKVLSGTEWGNLLLWDGGFIKVEISKKGKKPCHQGMVETLLLDEGELISAGLDGYIRIWDFETIDNADITEDNTLFEIEPLAEIKVGSDVSIKSLTRSTDPDTPTLWYVQDAKGALWKVDIIASHSRKPPEKIVSYHSGEIRGVDCSPLVQAAASIAEDGSVRVYNLHEKKVLSHCKYSSGGSTLVWAPLSVDPSGLTLLTGYSDGVLRVLAIEARCFSDHPPQHKGHPAGEQTLQHVSKPHTQAITTLAVSKDGALLATGSEDCSVFFLSVRDQYEPVGFTSTFSPVVKLLWLNDKELLVCCEDDTMLSVTAPQIGEQDTSKSYQLEDLTTASRKLVSIKERLRREEAEAIKAAERERKRKEKEEKRRALKEKRREELGEDYQSDEEEEEEEEDEEEEEEDGEKEEEGEEEEERPSGPSPILAVFQHWDEESKYWLSLGGYDAGYLYCCSLKEADNSCSEYEPFTALPVPPHGGRDIPLHSLSFNHSGEYLLTGLENGCVRVHQLTQPYSLTGLGDHWTVSMHDVHTGRITGLALTHDNQYLITTGADGNIFVYTTNLQSPPPRAPPAQQEAVEVVEAAEDIDDPTHYSIEDAKQKAEHDRMLKEAEAKKQKVRREITRLRKTFALLQNDNRKLPPHLRLGPSDFIMDPSMEQRLRQQTEEKIEILKKKLTWESEKHSIALRKLHDRFKANIECERIVVWEFKDHFNVSSFRTPKLSPEYIEALEKILSSDLTLTASDKTAGARHLQRRLTLQANKEEQEEEDGGAEEAPQEDTGVELSKNEKRRRQKEQRKKEWKELYKRKPGEGYEDPEEVLAMQKATQHMGDYKLKSSSDYVVSEEQRMTTEKTRKQLLLMRKMIFETKRKFNEKLIDLRDSKVEIVTKITQLVEELHAVQSRLPAKKRLPVPSIPQLKAEEVPERKLEYTKDSLLKFKAELIAREEAEKQAKAMGDGFGGFGGFGGGGGGGGGGDKKKEDKQEEEEQVDKDATEQHEDTSKPSEEEEDEEEEGGPALSEIQRLMIEEEQVRLLYRQDSIIAEVEKMKEDFDEALFRLVHEKAYTNVAMKTAEIRHITLFQELELLKEFEKQETSLSSRYESKEEEKFELDILLEEATWNVQEKEKQLSKLLDRERHLHAHHTELVAESKFKDYLVKVFKKKVKRPKQKPKKDVGEEEEEGSEDEESEEEESDSDEDDSFEEESDEEGFDDTVCPPGCDQGLYDQTLHMREKRLDIEEILTEERKLLEGMKKELESLKKKSRTIDSQAKTALSELQAFQLMKQHKLNKIDQVVVLKLHQFLHYKQDACPPTNVSQCLVFPAKAVAHLRQRIGELGVEKQQEKKRYKDLRLRHVKLVNEKKSMEHKVAELNAKADDMMMLKFGRIVNLDALEGLTTNKLIGELEQKIREQERQSDRRKRALEAQANTLRQELVAVTRENTDKLTLLHQLNTKSRELEESLNTRQKSMGADVGGGGFLLEPGEKERLVQIVRLQSNEIAALREEIRVLSSKGGHVLPPPEPPTAAGPAQLIHQ